MTGILGNAYARIFRGTAFTAMVTAVSFLVPVSKTRLLSSWVLANGSMQSGIAAAGGLAQVREVSTGPEG